MYSQLECGLDWLFLFVFLCRYMYLPIEVAWQNTCGAEGLGYTGYTSIKMYDVRRLYTPTEEFVEVSSLHSPLWGACEFTPTFR